MIRPRYWGRERDETETWRERKRLGRDMKKERMRVAERKKETDPRHERERERDIQSI